MSSLEFRYPLRQITRRLNNRQSYVTDNESCRSRWGLVIRLLFVTNNEYRHLTSAMDNESARGGLIVRHMTDNETLVYRNYHVVRLWLWTIRSLTTYLDGFFLAFWELPFCFLEENHLVLFAPHGGRSSAAICVCCVAVVGIVGNWKMEYCTFKKTAN